MTFAEYRVAPDGYLLPFPGLALWQPRWEQRSGRWVGLVAPTAEELEYCHRAVAERGRRKRERGIPDKIISRTRTPEEIDFEGVVTECVGHRIASKPFRHKTSLSGGVDDLRLGDGRRVEVKHGRWGDPFALRVPIERMEPYLTWEVGFLFYTLPRTEYQAWVGTITVEEFRRCARDRDLGRGLRAAVPLPQLGCPKRFWETELR